MTVDPKGATGLPAGGDPQGTGTAGATDPNAAETQEQTIARLQAAVEQGKAEKSTLEEAKRRAEAAEARIAQLETSVQPPTTPAPANPVQKVLSEISYYQQLVNENPNDFAADRLLRAAQQELGAWQWQALEQRETPKINALQEPLRSKAMAVFQTRRYIAAEDAIAVARGLIAEESTAQTAAERKRREAADAAAAAAAANKPDTGGGSGSEPAGTTKRQAMTGTDFTNKTKVKTAEARKLIEQLDQGQVEVDWSR